VLARQEFCKLIFSDRKAGREQKQLEKCEKKLSEANMSVYLDSGDVSYMFLHVKTSNSSIWTYAIYYMLFTPS
jgi:hypothetical protein